MNFIFEKQNVVSKETCDNLINLFDCSPYAYLEPHKSIKTGSSVILTEEFLHKNDSWKSLYNETMECLGDSIQDYIEDFYQSLNFIGQWRNDDYCILTRYNPGESFMDWHCEQGNLRKSSRMMAWMIYLNDVSDGGETVFLNQRHSIAPEAGKVVIWPAAWTHTHKGLVSKTQTKYILTGWFKFY